MAYDGSGRRVSKTRYSKACVSDEADGVYAADWERELVTHYTGIGTEVRESFHNGTPSETKVVVNMPQGLGRYGVEDAEKPSSGNATFEWYLKNHLGSTMLVAKVSSSNTPAEISAAYDYRAFGEQITLSEPTDKVTENFTGKEKDDETELNYFGARYLDPMLGLWISVDPKRQFASPYLYAGNGMNPIGAIDPDGNETIINLSGDNVVLNMTYNAEGNNLVKFNNANGTSFTANEPPSSSYFYSKNNEGRYKIEGQSFDVNMQANADEMLDQAFDAWPADFGCWRSGGALDFKNVYYKGAENTVGVVNGTAMTARDAGNAMWGGWVNTMYPMPKPAMNFISDVVAGGKEDASSAVMQNWGYDNYKP